MPIVPVGTFSAYSDIIPTGFGYICGGNATPQSKILKFNLSNETLTTSTSNLLTSSAALLSGVSNKSIAGYVARGRDGTSLSATKINYSNDVTSTISNIFTTAAYGRASVCNNNVAGYFTGGTGSAGTVASSVTKLVFSTDTSSVSTSMPTGNYYIAGVSNSGIAGYINRGNASGLYKLNFTNDTFSTVATAMTAPTFVRYDMSSFENTGVGGYFSGGSSGGTYYNTIVKLSFISETGFVVPETMPTVKSTSASISHTQVAGYITGGSTAGTLATSLNTINKILFNSDTISTISATLPSADYQATGISNGGIV